MPDGQLRDGAVGQPARHLDRALAEGAGAHDEGPSAVLNSSGEKLGRTHRPAVDECDQGSRRVAAGVGVQGALLAVDVVRGDQAAVEEGGGGGDGLGDQAAGVGTQVEDDAGVARGLPDGRADLVTGALGEGVDPDDGDRIGDFPDGDRVRGQLGPAQGLGPRARAALQAEADGGAGAGFGGVPAQ